MVCSACRRPCSDNCDVCGDKHCTMCCKTPCLRWGFDGCFLRGRCADGTELDPLNLCNWLKVHETCTSLRLVTKTTMNDSYLEFLNECDESYKIYVCDFLGLASIRCLADVWDYPDPDSGAPDAARPCDLFVFDPDCDSDPDNPKHNKWVPYHIPDAGDCVVVPDEDGYSRVLVKDDCGCIRECKLFIQQNTYEYALRDSWPDDPDWPFTNGSFTEVIDLELDKRIPMFGVSDLEVTVQYAYGIQNHDGSSSSLRNFKSIVTPTSENTETPPLGDTYSKAIVLQGCNLLPWGSWEWQASRSFIVPKGQKLYLVNKVECRDINTHLMGPEDNIASSRLHALHVFVRATKGVKV